MEFSNVFEVKSTPTHQWRAPDKDNDRDDDDGCDDEKTHMNITHIRSIFIRKRVGTTDTLSP